jgi:calcium-dependent protein kinase
VRIKPDKVGGSAFETKKVMFGLKAFSKRVKTGQLASADAANAQRHVYALKSIILDRVKDAAYVDELKNEISILRSLDHPNIVKLHEVYMYRKQIYLVLELCDGGDLYTRSPYSEREAARICLQITSAVCYLHSHGVVHRDLVRCLPRHGQRDRKHLALRVPQSHPRFSLHP